MGIAVITKTNPPSVPSRTAAVPALAPLSALPDVDARSPVTDDPYGELADLDFGNGGIMGTGGGYETDIPRPRGGEEDLLF